MAIPKRPKSFCVSRRFIVNTASPRYSLSWGMMRKNGGAKQRRKRLVSLGVPLLGLRANCLNAWKKYENECLPVGLFKV